jgi:hypothetical protein
MRQGAILADCLAMWLAGHQDGEKEKRRKLLLAHHIAAVTRLVPIRGGHPEEDEEAEEWLTSASATSRAWNG